MSEQSSQSSLGIPVAIVIAAALIAGAIIFTGSQKTAVTAPTDTTQPTPTADVVVPAPNEDDHILGNPNAPVMVVEYSDYDCPFCKVFHETMHRIMTDFGTDGSVAWTYRHFPIAQLHPNAPKIAEASECVAEQGGNDAFWTFTDLVFGERGTNEPTDMTKLAGFASQAGVDSAAFTTCLDSGTYTAHIADDIQAAAAAGARGTPYSIILAGDEKILINGAEPYEMVKQKIEAALAL